MDLSAVAPPDDDELVVVVGPTASGKTELAIQLCEKLGGEIISADSVQVYREFDIGSGKPTPAERARAVQHLIDVRDPMDPIDASQWAALAEAAIADVRARKKVPIVCGGTFLWVKALVRGLVDTPPADPALRAEHIALAEREGRAALHQQLATVDPVSAERIAPNDLVRVSRALEIHALTGQPQSEWFASHGFRSEKHRARLIGVERPRPELDTRIAARVDGWLEAGWIDEVKDLLDRGWGEARAMQSVGYRQVRDHLAGEIDRDELALHIVRATRTFVRRQRTWLRDEPITWIQS